MSQEKEKDGPKSEADRRPYTTVFNDIPDEEELQFFHLEDATKRPKRGTLLKLISLLAHERGRGTLDPP